MFKNYLIITLRNLKKHKGYSFITVFGLAVGMAGCIMILLYVQNEFSYDQYNENADRICRILSVNPKDGSVQANSPYRLGPALRDEIPGVLETARFYNFWTPVTLEYGDNVFSENNFLYTDSSALDIFNFSFAKGNPKTALDKPLSLIITEKAAEKYFGAANPMGKVLIADNMYMYTVTGVIGNVRENSHFNFDFLAYDPLRIRNFGSMLDQWHFINFKTYLLLSQDTSFGMVEKQIPAFLERHAGKQAASRIRFLLQPLTRIHLYSSHVKWDFGNKGHITSVVIFSAVALLILLIAGFNYMNLSITRSVQRSREVGIRKAAGADRSQLIKQFLGEAVLLSILALFSAVLLVESALPQFNRIIQKNLTLNIFHDGFLFLELAGIALLVGIVSGLYPSLYLSAFQPVQMLKNETGNRSKNSVFRKSFVVMQFVISSVLIIGAWIINSQIQFLHNKNLGFQKEQLIVADKLPKNFSSFKNELIRNPRILDAASASSVPPNTAHYSDIYPEGKEKAVPIKAKCFFADHNFINMLGISVAEGRSFSKDFETDANEAVMINQTAAEELGWTSALGKTITIGWNEITGKIIGVVEDFHFKSLHEKIEPVVFSPAPNDRYVMAVRIRGDNISQTMAYLKKKWKDLYPDGPPFSYHFVDQAFENLYRSEQKLSKLIGYFSLLAVFLACLGLFGLAAFMAKQRTKELGIRRVLGASVSKVIWLLIKDFSKWILAANIIAWPIAWYVLTQWLQNFAYRIDISWQPFFLSALSVTSIALITVGYQTFKAASADPAETLRYE